MMKKTELLSFGSDVKTEEELNAAHRRGGNIKSLIRRLLRFPVASCVHHSAQFRQAISTSSSIHRFRTPAQQRPFLPSSLLPPLPATCLPSSAGSSRWRNFPASLRLIRNYRLNFSRAKSTTPLHLHSPVPIPSLKSLRNPCPVGLPLIPDGEHDRRMRRSVALLVLEPIPVIPPETTGE